MLHQYNDDINYDINICHTRNGIANTCIIPVIQVIFQRFFLALASTLDMRFNINYIRKSNGNKGVSIIIVMIYL